MHVRHALARLRSDEPSRRRPTPNKGAKHLSTRVFSPYKSETKYVEATVRMRVRTFFGVDRRPESHRPRAPRGRREAGRAAGDWAIYSHDYTGCDAGEGLEFDNGPGIVDQRARALERALPRQLGTSSRTTTSGRSGARSTRTSASRASTRSRTARPTGTAPSRVTPCPRTGSSSRGPRGTRRSSSTGRTAAARTSALRRSTSRPARSS